MPFVDDSLVDQHEARAEAARACFLQHDVDGSGSIDASELAAALESLGLREPGESDESFRALVGRCMHEHDINGGGTLSFNEFSHLYNAVKGVAVENARGALARESPPSPSSSSSSSTLSERTFNQSVLASAHSRTRRVVFLPSRLTTATATPLHPHPRRVASQRRRRGTRQTRGRSLQRRSRTARRRATRRRVASSPRSRTTSSSARRSVRLLPVRPRSRGERRSLRTFPVVTLHPRFPFNV